MPGVGLVESIRTSIDEAASISRRTLDALTYGDVGPSVVKYSVERMLQEGYTQSTPAKAVIKPAPIPSLDVPCDYCNAAPGQRCTKYHPKRGRIERRKAHRQRSYRARAVTSARDALLG